MSHFPLSWSKKHHWLLKELSERYYNEAFLYTAAMQWEPCRGWGVAQQVVRHWNETKISAIIEYQPVVRRMRLSLEKTRNYLPITGYVLNKQYYVLICMYVGGLVEQPMSHDILMRWNNMLSLLCTIYNIRTVCWVRTDESLCANSWRFPKQCHFTQWSVSHIWDFLTMHNFV